MRHPLLTSVFFLPSVLAVFGMSENLFDVNLTTTKPDARNQPIFVASDVKNGHGHPAVRRYRIRIEVSLTDILQILPIGFPGDFIPLPKRCFGIPFFYPEFFQSPEADDPLHEYITYSKGRKVKTAGYELYTTVGRFHFD